MSESTEEVGRIEKQIEALKRQRGRIECLLMLLRESKQIVDMWSMHYLSIFKLRGDLGGVRFALPTNERKMIEKQTGMKGLDVTEEQVNKLLTSMIEQGSQFTVDELSEMVNVIDDTIIELMVYVREIKNGKKEMIVKAKDFMLKRLGPIAIGITLISVNWSHMNWPTILGGSALVLKGIA